MTRRVRGILALLSLLAAALLHLWLQAGMMLGWAGWRPSYFRNYFWPDQLAYLSIAVNVAHGESPDVEPFTLTGSNNYPRAWYVFLGYASRLLGTSPATVWTFAGLAVQVAVVVAIGATCILLTRRWWTGVLGAVPFLLGTGSWMLSSGTSWMTKLDSHAVLWGPYGVLFTLNGETVALGMGCVALLALLLVAAGRVPERARLWVAIAACGLIGLIANVQTYAFLTSTFVLFGGVAAVGLVRSRSRAALLWTVGLVALVFVLGPVVAGASGQLSVVMLGLVPAVPGVLVVLRDTRWRPLWGALALALCALPQIAATVWGLIEHDPFLVYREGSSKNLGVQPGPGLFSALAVLPALALVIVLGVRRRQVVWIAVPSALVVLWAYLSTNDLWGANQEPYRFWIDMYVLVAVLTVPLVAWSVIEVLSRSREAGAELTRRGRAVLVGALVLCVAVAATWSWDFTLFRTQVTAGAYLPLTAPQYRAQADLLDRSQQDGGGLVLLDGCTDPWYTNAIWGGPVAYYHVGLAWPEHREDIDKANHARDHGHLDEAAAKRAGIRWMMVVPGCKVDITAGVDAHPVATTSYGGGSWVLWKLDG